MSATVLPIVTAIDCSFTVVCPPARLTEPAAGAAVSSVMKSLNGYDALPAASTSTAVTIFVPSLPASVTVVGHAPDAYERCWLAEMSPWSTRERLGSLLVTLSATDAALEYADPDASDTAPADGAVVSRVIVAEYSAVSFCASSRNFT